MSISTQGGDQRRPSVVGKKAVAGGKPADEAEGGKAQAGKPGSDRPAGAKVGRPAGGPKGGKPGGATRSGGGKGPRKPVTPVKIGHGRNWGPIALFVAVGLIAAGIIGYGGYAAFKGSRSWQDRAGDISGIVNYRETNPGLLKREHKAGPLTYTVVPPVGGVHNNDWQNCMGDIYDAPIANEHAVHSLEHGGVWIAYKPGLAADQVEKLASKVRGTDFTMMSPVEGLDKNISLQAWGYQLKLDKADDPRIDEFIKALRLNASMEPGVGCSGGITATGTTPRNLPPRQQPEAPAQPGG